MNVATAPLAAARPTADVAIRDESDGRRVVAVAGRLDATTLPSVWPTIQRAASENLAQPIVIDAAGVEYCDGAGIALFVELLRHPREGKIDVVNLNPTFATLLAQYKPQVFDHDLDPEPVRGPVDEEIVRKDSKVCRDLRDQGTFIG